MSEQSPLPAIDPNALGTEVSVAIDVLLIPYVLGVVEALTNPNVFDGDPEDVQGTVYAFADLLHRLSIA